MKNRSKNIIAMLAAVVAGCVIPLVSQASPYASSVTNNAGTVSFILNESADNVKVIYGTTTNDLGALSAGSQTFALGAINPVKIQVTKNSGPGWKTPAGTNLTHTVGTNTAVVTPWAGRLWISDSNNLLTRYPSPRGISVNRDPASPYFGRVYVANSTPGTTAGRPVGRGLYTMNADLSDSPNGYGDTAQQNAVFALGGSGAGAPYQTSLGADGYLYVADFSDLNGNVFRVDPNLQNLELVFTNSGGPTTIVPPQNHGSLKRVRTTGTLAGGNLKVYTMDEDYTNSIPVLLATQKGSILRYDINSGPLTNSIQPVLLATPTPSWTVTTFQDFDIGTNGYIYAMQNRSAGVEPGIYVIDAATGAAITNTRAIWRDISGNATNVDIMVNLDSIAVSPDCKYLAVALLAAGNPFGSDCWIIPLTNGIPDLTKRMVLDTSTVNQARGVDFDAAGNLYTISSGDAQLRVWSPGGSTTITTGTDGSFDISTPPNTVSVTASVAAANEAGPVNGVFAIARSGDTSASLTVNYSFSGTATPGVDFTSLPGTVTFLPGATTTNITVAVSSDSESELTETVLLTIGVGTGYGVGSPATATVNISDANTPEITISGLPEDGARTNLLESFADSSARLVLTRKGSLASATTVNFTYSGAAGAGVDYNAPASVTFQAGAVTTNVLLTPINDSAVEAPEAYTISIQFSGSYNLGVPASASGLIYSEDLPLGTPLFADAFDTDTAANWMVNKSPDGDSDATFSFDYGTMGIPEAPNSAGGSAATRGLQLRAHVGSDTSITPGISVSPTGQSFTGDYRVRFDAWINYVGPLNVGGAGSTEHASYGLGTAGTAAIWPGSGFSDCIWFTTASDGDVGESSLSQADYGVFVGPGLQSALSGYYAAGTDVTNRGNGDFYYNVFGGSVAPANQLTSFPSQSSTVRRGALGMAWHSVVLTKEGDAVTWDVDGYRIASVGVSGAGIPLADNIFLGFHDWFASTNGNPTLTFALYDNLRVESLEPPLSITSIQVDGTTVTVNFTAASSTLASAFELHRASVVDGSYTKDTGANITGSGGVYQAVTTINGDKQFYKIKKP